MRTMLLAIALVFASKVVGQYGDEIGFAESLLREGDYYRAVSEYKRFLYFNPSTPEADSARLGIGRSLFFAGQQGLLEQWFLTLPRSCGIRSEAVLITARGIMDSGAMHSASSFLQSHRDDVSSGDMPDYYLLSGVTLARSGLYDAAAESFSQVDPRSPRGSVAESYLDLLEASPTAEPRDPTIAALLGIVPGLGYAYSGHYGTAAASLVVNGLLAWGSISAFNHNNDEAGYALSVVGFGFYTGNIYGSAQSARRYNTHIHSEYRARFAY